MKIQVDADFPLYVKSHTKFENGGSILTITKIISDCKSVQISEIYPDTGNSTEMSIVVKNENQKDTIKRIYQIGNFSNQQQYEFQWKSLKAFLDRLEKE